MRRHPRVQLQPRRQVSGRSWLRAATGIAGRRSERRRQAGREGGRHAPCKCVASVVDTAQAERLRVSLRVAREGRCVCVGRVTRHQHITQPPCARKHRHATRCSFPCNLQFILSKLETAIANYIAKYCNNRKGVPSTSPSRGRRGRAPSSSARKVWAGGASKMRANHSPGLCSDCSIRNRTLPLLYVNKRGGRREQYPDNTNPSQQGVCG